jgi:hypothetical protein
MRNDLTPSPFPKGKGTRIEETVRGFAIIRKDR